VGSHKRVCILNTEPAPLLYRKNEINKFYER
jgi:hypothetical protein